MRFSNPGDLIQVILESSGVLAPPFKLPVSHIFFSPRQLWTESKTNVFNH